MNDGEQKAGRESQTTFLAAFAPFAQAADSTFHKTPTLPVFTTRTEAFFGTSFKHSTVRSTSLLLGDLEIGLQELPVRQFVDAELGGHFDGYLFQFLRTDGRNLGGKTNQRRIARLGSDGA